MLIEDLTIAGPSTKPPATPEAIKENYGNPGTRVKLQGMRRKIAEHMVHAEAHDSALHLCR